MEYLEFNVKGMAISQASGSKKLISGAVNYFGLHFNFDEEFANIPGGKAVEFSKNRQSRRVDLVDGACAIPNELLTDNKNFEMRVVSGNTVGTTWLSVGITESGVIFPERPEEEPPAAMEYVKTESGDGAVPFLRAITNGLEYSHNGLDWESGISGVPEVPKKPSGGKYVRSYGDWVLTEDPTGEENIIEEVKVNDVTVPIENKSVNIDLSEYQKKNEAEEKYATKNEVTELQTLSGTASQLTLLDYGETDTATIVSKINEIIAAMQTRGIVTA